MRQRVGIAAALARDPRVLIADEPTTALDVTTQRDVLALIKGIQAARGMSLILITHDLRVAFAVCDRIYVLYAGSLVEVGKLGRARRRAAAPLQPRTASFRAVGRATATGELVAIPGSVPAPDDVAGSCTFAPRCRWAAPPCTEEPPLLVEVAPGRLSACVRVAEIRGRDGHAAATSSSRRTARPSQRNGERPR